MPLDPQLSSAAGTSRQVAANPQEEEDLTTDMSKGIKKTPVHKWQPRFSGGKGSIVVNGFIEKAEK